MRILVLPGDGIGPEVVAQGRLVLEACARRFGFALSFTEAVVGGAAIDAFHTALPDGAMHQAQSSDAVLLGAVGGPRWDDPRATVRPEQALLRLRKELGLFANLRPVRVFPELLDEGLEPFEIPNLWLSAEHPDTYVDITSTIDVKLAALAEHRSQQAEASAPWVRERARQLGEEGGVEYAEAFKAFSFVDDED